MTASNQGQRRKIKKGKDSYQVIFLNSLLFCLQNNYFVTTASIIRLNRGVLLCLKTKQLECTRFITRSCKDTILSYFWIHNHLLAELYLVPLLVIEFRQLAELWWSGGGKSAFKLNKLPRTELRASPFALWAPCWANSFTAHTGLRTRASFATYKAQPREALTPLQYEEKLKWKVQAKK